MHVPYAPEMTMRAARDLYFDVNGFGADGGDSAAWVDFKIGPVPLPFPNTAGRVKALGFHDLHHVLTGYETNATGEFEIAGWELGAGCEGYVTAWVLSFGGLASGLLATPHRVFRSFVRGRRSRNLFAEQYESLLDLTVAEARARHLAADDARATAADVCAFAAMALAAMVIGLMLAALAVPVVPVGLVAAWFRRRQAPTSVTA